MKDTLGFLRYFFAAFPGRSTAIIILLVVAGFAEGLGVVTLLPLLETLDTGSGDPSRLAELVVGLLSTFGLEANVVNLLGLIVVGITLKGVLLWLAMRQVGFTVAWVTTKLRLDLMRSLLKARWSYFTGESKGDLAAAVGSETQRTVAAFREACTSFAQIVQVVVYTAISVTISWTVTVFAVVGAGIFWLLLRRFFDMAREAGQMQTTRVRSLTSRLIEALGAIKPVKAMAQEDQVLPLLEDETRGLYDALHKRVQAFETLKLFQEPVVTLFLALGIGFALTLDLIPMSSLLLMAFVFHRLMSHVNTLMVRYQSVVNGESAFWALRRQMDEAEGAAEVPAGDGEPPPRLSEEIRLEGVSFSYGDHPVVSGVDLLIPAGRFVSLIGRSGAGKTTVADLILGLHTPDEGRVLVDGRPLDTLDLMEWRRQIGYVPQETFLFHDTILRNVTLGDERFTPDQVEGALRDADAWDFVASRPDGLHTMVGESGAKLSGGQRQRIAIARALVRRPSLLVLDEATTALDPATERAICDTLRGLAGRVTILAISHQRALRDAADVVYEIEDGRVRQLEENRLESPV